MNSSLEDLSSSGVSTSRISSPLVESQTEPVRAIYAALRAVNDYNQVYGIRAQPVGHADVLRHSRKAEVALARHVAMVLLKKTDMSFPAIGMFLGNRDHSTIMHGCKKIRQLCEENNRRVLEVVAAAEMYYVADTSPQQ